MKRHLSSTGRVCILVLGGRRSNEERKARVQEKRGKPGNDLADSVMRLEIKFWKRVQN